MHMCLYLCMKREKEEQERESETKGKKKEMKHFQMSLTSLTLGLTYHCP